MKNVLVVYNNNAGRKKGIMYKKKLHKYLLKEAVVFKFVTLDELRDVDITPYETIVAMGGDGTVNAVIPFVINDKDKTLGIIPCGTANLLAAKLGISSNLKKALNIIETQNIREIDVLNINDNYCALRFGISYDSNIIIRTPQTLKNKFGYFSYFIAGILFALRLKEKTYEMTMDNTHHSINSTCIIIANAANMYKDIISVAKKSSPEDGLMDIFILKTSNPVLFFIEFIRIILNIKTNNSRAIYHKAKEINIKNTWLSCHIDGEKKKIKGDIKINILPKTLKVYSK